LFDKECIVKTKQKALGLLAILMLCGMVFIVSGCKDDGTSTAKADTVALCADCGQVKGSDVCCVVEAEVCDTCSLAKGAPGCCIMEKGDTTVALCTDCGQLAGSDVCCDPDQAKCEKCQLAEGSPGCCKLPIEI
jgi:hypothetical protein